jgi:translation initiation factor IF-3
MRLRGRERAFTDRWIERLEEIVVELQESLERDVKVTQRPKSEGREITCMVEPA